MKRFSPILLFSASCLFLISSSSIKKSDENSKTSVSCGTFVGYWAVEDGTTTKLYGGQDVLRPNRNYTIWAKAGINTRAICLQPGAKYAITSLSGCEDILLGQEKTLGTILTGPNGSLSTLIMTFETRCSNDVLTTQTRTYAFWHN